ncbi:hypothetical protein Tco_0812653 [Tanacetum coccineum]
MLAPPVVVDEGSKQPTEPQPTSSTAPQEILHQVATATTSQPPEDPHIFWITKRCQNTKVPQSGGSPKKVGDEAINEKMFDSMEMAITTIASLDATHDKSHTSGNGEGNMEHHFELTDNVPHTPHDSPLSGGNITGSDKGRIELIKDLMETSLTKRVLALEEAKTAQDRIIAAQRKFRATQRAAEIKSKPPTKTQLRNLMMTYLNNTGGYKHIHLKGKTYEEIHELYERQQKRNQDFIPIDLEKEAQKSGKRLKRVAGSYTTQKSPKKSKVIKFTKNVTEEEAAEYEKEKEELRLSLKIIFGDDSEVNYEPLSRRFLIVNLEYKLLGSVDTKGMYVYILTRADESSSYHRDMQAFLRRLE